MVTRNYLSALLGSAACILLLLTVLPLTAFAEDLPPSWDFVLPDNGGDDPAAIMSVYTEPGHDILYVWTFDGDLYALNNAGSVLWRGYVPETVWQTTLNPDGDIWLYGSEQVRGYSRTGKLLIDNAFEEQPPQKQAKRAVVTTLSPDYDAVYGLNIDGEYAWSVYGLGESMFVVKTNINPGMYFLIDAMNFEDPGQEFHALDPWGSIKWSYDATDIGSMPERGVSAVIRRDGSLLLAQAVGTDAVNGEYDEPGVVVSLSAAGEFEWMYPDYVCLTTDHPARGGIVHVATSDFAVRAVDRNGADLWQMSYDDTDLLLGCYTLPDGGVIMHLWAYIPGTDDLYADYLARIDANGDIVTERWPKDPQDYYGYGVLLGETLVITDGEQRLAAFELE